MIEIDLSKWVEAEGKRHKPLTPAQRQANMRSRYKQMKAALEAIIVSKTHKEAKALALAALTT